MSYKVLRYSKTVLSSFKIASKMLGIEQYKSMKRSTIFLYKIRLGKLLLGLQVKEL